MCQEPTFSAARARSVFGDNLEARPVGKSSKRKVTWTELAQHNTAKDAWIAIRSRVYDVTSFANVHPGGKVILTAAGLDATDLFAAFHESTDAWRRLEPLRVGDMDDNDKPLVPGVDKEYVADILELRNQFHAMKLYESNKLYYLYKVLSTFAICFVSIAIIMHSGSWPAVIASGFLMGVFFQQSVWMAHDFLHHTVFVTRIWNDICSLFISTLSHGYSVCTWKELHNRHHAVPNVVDPLSGGDPDLDAAPLFVWSEKLLESNLDAPARWLLRHQGHLYWFNLTFLHFAGVIESLLKLMRGRVPSTVSLPMFIADCTAFFFYHVWFGALLFKIGNSYSVPKALIFAYIAYAIGGVFMGMVIGIGHNALEVRTEEERRGFDFFRLQACTSRNIPSSLFMDWFTGLVNFQIEHHLFPTMPRHNLWKAAVLVRPFCEKHNMKYTEEGLLEANFKVVETLKRVSKNGLNK